MRSPSDILLIQDLHSKKETLNLLCQIWSVTSKGKCPLLSWSCFRKVSFRNLPCFERSTALLCRVSPTFTGDCKLQKDPFAPVKLFARSAFFTHKALPKRHSYGYSSCGGGSLVRCSYAIKFTCCSCAILMIFHAHMVLVMFGPEFNFYKNADLEDHLFFEKIRHFMV